jgi:sugar phosphate isomerase/epimerase
MMKTGFSSRFCPSWDLETIASNASAMGYDGVELCGLQGESDLTRVAALANQPERVRSLLRETNTELVCLSAPVALDSCSESEIHQRLALLENYAKLAHELTCPCVRLSVGEVQALDNRNMALARIAKMLRLLIPIASRFHVTMLVENGGDFRGSEDSWFLIDAVGHPAVQCCWNQCHALTLREQATRSIPRLNSRIGLVHACDASFDEQGRFIEFKKLGEGDAGVARQIELLKGLMYDRYLVFDQPARTSADPKAVLEPAARFLRACIEAEPAPLSAYKGDKRAPRMASPARSIEAA